MKRKRKKATRRPILDKLTPTKFIVEVAVTVMRRVTKAQMRADVLAALNNPLWGTVRVRKVDVD